MEFKAFNKINSLGKIRMQITQKIHGTNAQIVIVKLPDNVEGVSISDLRSDPIVEVDGAYYNIRAGSRNRWLFVGDDNYNFASFVDKNKEEIIRKLGPGQHFGEWAGLGINSGEGLKEKLFVLFDVGRYVKEGVVDLPPQTVLVPVLYEGPFDLQKIEEVKQDLKTNGSKLSPGYMHPEGVVISVLGTRLKSVFDAEETQWTKSRSTGPKEPKDDGFDRIAHLLQPIRLEKLLSRDEVYMVGYPKTLPLICRDYVKDLVEEGQIVGDEDQVESLKKILGKHVFPFVKDLVKMHSGV